MAERANDDKPVLHRSGEPPTPGQRKEPSRPVKALPDKLGAESPGHSAGSSALLSTLRDVRFPATRKEILNAAGDRLIPIGDGRTVRMATVVEKTSPAEFASARQFVAEANAIWDDIERTAQRE